MKKEIKDIRVGNIRYDLDGKGYCFQFVVFHNIGDPCNIVTLGKPIHIESEKFLQLVEKNKLKIFYFN